MESRGRKTALYHIHAYVIDRTPQKWYAARAELLCVERGLVMDNSTIKLCRRWFLLVMVVYIVAVLLVCKWFVGYSLDDNSTDSQRVIVLGVVYLFAAFAILKHWGSQERVIQELIARLILKSLAKPLENLLTTYAQNAISKNFELELGELRNVIVLKLLQQRQILVFEYFAGRVGNLRPSTRIMLHPKRLTSMIAEIEEELTRLEDLLRANQGLLDKATRFKNVMMFSKTGSKVDIMRLALLACHLRLSKKSLAIEAEIKGIAFL